MATNKTNASKKQSNHKKREADPKFVRHLADKVYALLLADWQILLERNRNR